MYYTLKAHTCVYVGRISNTSMSNHMPPPAFDLV